MTLNKIINHKGDVIDAALSGEYDKFIHVANCLNIMNAGVALQVRKRIPELYQEDCEFHIKKEHRLGMCSSVVVNETMMFNLYAQQVPDSSSRQLNYGALVSSLLAALDDCFQAGLEKTIKVCLPRLMGCALSGGDWEIVEELLGFIDFECFVEFHVYDFN
jgi:O-acetyl-ADP-ribose deacetylase (regulator of RNase III)